ncbi:MAG: hypothetical protein KGJ02_07040 [Verrucomicrobiota bacterium]|nr:hypothetical protein [Verrucomicrobiota bacterium]
MKKWIGLLLLPLFGFSLEVQPWFGDVYEFHLLSSYTYSRFTKIQGGDPPLNFPFNVNLVYFDLDFSPSPEWSIDLDFQLADTSKQSFNVRTTAIQGRYLWLDDIIGDWISLTTGASIRFTPTYALNDVSCPSHANADFVFNFSFGKELEARENWLFRLWFYGEVGHGNRGSPWIRGIAAVETNVEDHHKLALYADGTSGYGRYTHIDVNSFDGYAKIRNKSIDLGFRYGYRIGVWGTIRAEYIRRVLARASPAQVNSVVISYLLPFSF